MSDSSRLQHTRLLCPSPPPGVCPSSCPLNQWCHPTISSSIALFWTFCLQSYPASGSFPRSQLFASDGQNIGASASAQVLPKSIQGRFLLRLTDLISLPSKGLSRIFSSTTVWKHQFFGTQPLSGWKVSSGRHALHDHPCYILMSVLFPIAAVSSHCKHSGLSRCRSILSMSGGQKSKIKASAGLVPWGGCFFSFSSFCQDSQVLGFTGLED